MNRCSLVFLDWHLGCRPGHHNITYYLPYLFQRSIIGVWNSFICIFGGHHWIEEFCDNCYGTTSYDECVNCCARKFNLSRYNCKHEWQIVDYSVKDPEDIWDDFYCSKCDATKMVKR